MYNTPHHNPHVVGDDGYESDIIISPVSPAKRTSTWHPDSWSLNRFSRGKEHDNEAHGHSNSPYSSENGEESSDSVRFNKVEWKENQQQKRGGTPRSTISTTEEFQLSKSRGDGLGIHGVGEVKEVIFDHEKVSWEPTQPPPSAYRPLGPTNDFEDVELNKPHERGTSSMGSLVKVKRRACTENHIRLLLWALVLALPFIVMPLAIFGGVYKFGNAEGLCKAGRGTWNAAARSCQY